MNQSVAFALPAANAPEKNEATSPKSQPSTQLELVQQDQLSATKENVPSTSQYSFVGIAG